MILWLFLFLLPNNRDCRCHISGLQYYLLLFFVSYTLIKSVVIFICFIINRIKYKIEAKKDKTKYSKLNKPVNIAFIIFNITMLIIAAFNIHWFW